MTKQLYGNRDGSALIAISLVALILLASVAVFANWVHIATKSTVQSLAKQRALTSADSGVQAALQWLRQPQAAQLAPGTTSYMTGLQAGTTFQLVLYRRSTDHSMVDVTSNGYFPIKSGNATVNDQPNGVPAQKAVILAQIQLRNVGDYFAASPGSLEINYGSNISFGTIYANNLVFDSGSGNPKTKVKAAYFFSSVNPTNASSFVSFLDAPNQPVQLATQPNLPVLDSSMQNNYQVMAGADVLPNNTVLVDPVAPPANPYKVFYSPGNVILGNTTTGVTMSDSFLIYAEGDIIIANNVTRNAGTTAWPALLAAGNIYIDPTAPDILTVNATLETNGDVKAQDPARTNPNNSITITGGIVAGGVISFGSVYTGSRIYNYQAPDSALPLPFTTQMISYKVMQGAYTE